MRGTEQEASKLMNCKDEQREAGRKRKMYPPCMGVSGIWESDEKGNTSQGSQGWWR